MKILWLSHFVPFPPKGGCFQRSYNLLARAGAEHEVHLLALRHKTSIHPEAETLATRDELLRHCRSLQIIDVLRANNTQQLALGVLAGVLTLNPVAVTVCRSREVRQSIRAICARVKFDVVHFDTIALAQYIDEIGSVPAVVTHHGAESHMIRRRIPNERNGLKKAVYLYEWLALRSYERRMCRRFASNIVVSGEDAARLAAIAPGAAFTTIENGVDVKYFSAEPVRSGRRMVFAGRMDQYANRHGLQQFMSQVWPLVAARFEDASIDIIGNNPPESLRRIAGPQIRVHGFVPDVRPYFRDATLAVCPLWDGGGTRLKVLDTLAMGTPLVATSIACEGLAVQHERDALIADSPADLAEQIGRLFNDVDLRRRLQSNGRALVERLYSWETVAPKLTALYRGVAAADEAAVKVHSFS